MSGRSYPRESSDSYSGMSGTAAGDRATSAQQDLSANAYPQAEADDSGSRSYPSAETPGMSGSSTPNGMPSNAPSRMSGTSAADRYDARHRRIRHERIDGSQ